MPRITKTAIDDLKPDLPGDAWLWDSALPGFGVRVQASGHKSYVVRYRNHDGVQRKQNVCRCADATPDQARNMARKIFAQVAEGKDPRAERRIGRQNAASVEDLKVRYMAEWAVPPNKKLSSIAGDEKNWRLHILPFMGGRKVKEVSDGDISRLAAMMANTPATANQCIALISKAFGLAEKWNMRPRHSNPARGVRKYEIREKELILTLAQIAQLDRTLDSMTGSGRIRPACPRSIPHRRRGHYPLRCFFFSQEAEIVIRQASCSRMVPPGGITGAPRRQRQSVEQYKIVNGQTEPERFRLNPIQHMLRLNT